MCGIIGYAGNEKCVPILLEGLRTLEYRGYDSAGVTVAEDGRLVTVKSKGRLTELEEKLYGNGELCGSCGIGHTRWATHGEPSDKNSHPHTADTLALVHNGIIENYAEIEEILRGAGYTFASETDTERAAKLIDMFYKQDGEPLSAIARAVKVIRGSYAFGIIFKGREDTVYAVRHDSPLIVAHAESGSFIASDVTAILKYTNEYYRLDEGTIAVVGADGVTFYDGNLKVTEQPRETVAWNVEQAQKGGYAHFMIKEIHEEPDALRRTVEPRLSADLPHFGIDVLDNDGLLSRFKRLHVVACGTAMHAGLVGKSVIEKLARVPVDVEIASEFRYREPILGDDELVILLSQSGETADTLAALRHAKSRGIYTLAIVNVIGSSVAREADSVLYTWAGPEIAVASTKAYSVQCALLYLLAVRLGLANGRLDADTARDICRSMLTDIPRSVEKVLALNGEIYGIASRLVSAEHVFYIGRDVDCALAAEASLKLKEISYIHSEAYAAGELKHGTISLVTEGTPVIALMTVDKVSEKLISGIREVSSRGAYTVCVCSEELSEKYDIPCDKRLVIPRISELLAPFPTVTALQLLAYHVSALKGLDVDKPRNLAKSVTVE